MTNLAEYLRGFNGQRRTQEEVARRLGISRSYLSELASGAKRPSLDLAFRIERATGGAVRASDWLESGE